MSEGTRFIVYLVPARRKENRLRRPLLRLRRTPFHEGTDIESVDAKSQFRGETFIDELILESQDALRLQFEVLRLQDVGAFSFDHPSGSGTNT